MIHGVDFDQQLITAANMGHFMWTFSGKKNGVSKGCNMTRTTETITISAGYILVCGRMTEVSGYESVAIPSVESGSIYCRLVYEIDLSKTNTSEVFNQGEFKILQDNAAYPTLVQQDLDSNLSGKFQFPMAKFTVDINGVANWVDERATYTQSAIVEFTSSGWSNEAPYTQTVQTSEIIGSNAPTYGLYIESGTEVAAAENMMDDFGLVGRMETTQGAVTLTCYSRKPVVNFKIQVKE